MNTVRTSISLSESLYSAAQKHCAAEHFRSFSDYIEHLIREDWKARGADAAQPSSTPVTQAISAAGAGAAVVQARRKSRKHAAI